MTKNVCMTLLFTVYRFPTSNESPRGGVYAEPAVLVDIL
jgi:hypothetical protein